MGVKESLEYKNVYEWPTLFCDLRVLDWSAILTEADMEEKNEDERVVFNPLGGSATP